MKFKTDDKPIEIGDYFLEISENNLNYIHKLVDEYDEDNHDFKLKGTDVVVLSQDDFEWNRKDTEYKRICFDK